MRVQVRTTGAMPQRCDTRLRPRHAPHPAGTVSSTGCARGPRVDTDTR
jgi:hypothetical protein